jgi:hypothetical protein
VIMIRLRSGSPLEPPNRTATVWEREGLRGLYRSLTVAVPLDAGPKGTPTVWEREGHGHWRRSLTVAVPLDAVSSTRTAPVHHHTND